MFRRLFSTSAFALCVLSTLCLADPPADAGAGQDGDKPAGERREGNRRRFRAEGGERGGEGRRGPGRQGFGGPRFDPKAELAQMTEKLGLDEAQQNAIRQLFDDQQTKMAEMREKMRPTEEQREAMEAMREEMQAARESGDEAKIQELRGKMRETMGGRMEEMRKVMEENQKAMHDGILAQLREDQKPEFAKMWEARMERQRRGPGGPDRGPAALKSIVDKLDDLTSDQKAQLEVIFKNFRETSRDQAGPASRQANRKLHEDVMGVLTDTQKATVEKQLEGQRGRRERGEGRRDRGPRGDDEQKKIGV